MSYFEHEAGPSKSDVYLTPPRILAAVGRFDLDPCAAPEPRPWPTALVHYALPMNGLALPWFGRVWVNPPFGQAATPWLERLVEHGDGVALLPARTDTAAFYRFVWDRAAAVLFVRNRVVFHAGFDTTVQHNGRDVLVRWGEPFPFNLGAPVVLAAYGEHNAARLESCGLGACVRRVDLPTNGN